LAMAPNFHKRQRFHALIELGSKPFIAGVGPPQFGNAFLSPGEPATPDNVIIKNCKLGLTSHHGIHGNHNQGVKIHNVEIRDFEVAGIHLNGASNIDIQDAAIGPSLKQTFNARLSQTIFLDHLMNTLLPTSPHISVLREQAKVTIRGEEKTVKDVFKELHDALQTFFASTTGPLLPLVGDGTALPDGSAVYGIVIHTTGPAAGDFGSCPFLQATAQDRMVHGVSLKNVQVKDLGVHVDQITRLKLEGNQVMGPAGDVFNWRVLTDSEDRYVGDLIGDAQLSVGAFKKFLVNTPGVDQGALAWYFGGVHMPDDILTWASVKDAKWTGGRDFLCNGDAMSHANKGAVGLFLSNLNDGKFEGVTVSNIANTGGVDASGARCTQDGYKGADSRGLALVNSPAVETTGISVNAATITAASGGAVHDIQKWST